MKHWWKGTERENIIFRIKMSLFPPHISHGLTWNRTPDSAVTDRRLTAWTMTWSNNIYRINTSITLQFVPHREQMFSSWRNTPSGPGPAHYRGFTITLRHTTLIRTPLDEWSAWRRDLYLKTHNTHKRQAFMPLAGFEPKIPASERPQNQASECGPTGIGEEDCCQYKSKTC
jgi:hypothetical protein